MDGPSNPGLSSGGGDREHACAPPESRVTRPRRSTAGLPRPRCCARRRAASRKGGGQGGRQRRRATWDPIPR